ADAGVCAEHFARRLARLRAALERERSGRAAGGADCLAVGAPGGQGALVLLYGTDLHGGGADAGVEPLAAALVPDAGGIRLGADDAVCDGEYADPDERGG